MHSITRTTLFVLAVNIGTVPAGATGRLDRLDADHVVATFDDPKYSELVYDVHDDTEPGIRAKFMKPPRLIYNRTGLAISATVVGAFVTGWLSLPQPDVTHKAIESVIQNLVSGVPQWHTKPEKPRDPPLQI